MIAQHRINLLVSRNRIGPIALEVDDGTEFAQDLVVRIGVVKHVLCVGVKVRNRRSDTGRFW